MATEQYVKVASTSEIPVGKMKAVKFDGHEVCLADAGGNYCAIGERCTHVGAPLSEGTLKDHIVTCPWHGSQFDVRTGEVKHGPAMKPEPSYEVKVEGNLILLKQK
jgi:nitrite reductase/ring-hydroxylating ferredoxin subunit